MGGVEAATGGHHPDFPRAWGTPPGSQFSEERAAWVRDRVREHDIGRPLRQLAAADARLLWNLRIALHERNKRTP